jgi:hypothetical protein
MAYGEKQDQIKRASGIRLPEMRVADLVFVDSPYPGLPPMFNCARLNSSLTTQSCAANYTREDSDLTACAKCEVGNHHALGKTLKQNRHSANNAAMGLKCIRCERDAHSAIKFAGRFRLVQRNTLCVSCANRGYELSHKAGTNAKGGRSKLVLYQATIIIKNPKGENQTIDIGLRSGKAEAERYAARIFRGAKLLAVNVSAEPFEPAQTEATKLEAERMRLKRKKKIANYGNDDADDDEPNADDPFDCIRWTKKSGLRWGAPTVAPVTGQRDDSDAVSPAWLSVFGDPTEAPKAKPKKQRSQPLPALSHEDDEAYRASFDEGVLDPDSIAGHWEDMSAESLLEFVQWLCEDWSVEPPVSAESKPSPSALAKEHGISPTLVCWRLKAHGTVEVETDLNGSVLSTNNKSGLNGVRWIAGRNKWDARGWRDNRAVHIGYFDTIEAAAAARAAFDSRPATPSAPIVDTVAPAIVVDPVSEPVEPSVPVADHAAPADVVDPIAPTPSMTCGGIELSTWARGFVESGRSPDERDQRTGCDAITFTSGFEADDAEPVAHVETVAASEPAAQPVSDPVRKPQTSKLTGKAAAKQRKREAREARQSPAATVKRVPLPGIKHTAMAVVQIAFELNGFKA